MKENWSYLAGLFDGEGSVVINCYERLGPDSRGNGPYFYVQTELILTITNTFLPLMKWLVSNFGGVYYTKTHNHPIWKDAYSWRVKGAKNKERFLLGVLPYLIVKREQAQLALDYLRVPGNNNPELRQAIALKCKELNRRGKSVTTNTPDAEVIELPLKIESELAGDRESAPVMTQAA